MATFTFVSVSDITSSYVSFYMDLYEVTTVPQPKTVEEETPQTVEVDSFEEYINHKYQHKTTLLVPCSTFLKGDEDTQLLAPQQQWDAESFAAVYWDELCQQFDALNELHSCLHTVTPVAVAVDVNEIVEEVATDLRRSTFDDLTDCVTVVKRAAVFTMEEVARNAVLV